MNMMKYELQINDKIYFASEKRPYTVKAYNNKFAICTKPFNIRKSGLYTIIDWGLGMRNKNNMIFNPYDYLVQEDVEKCLIDLTDPRHVCEISHRGAVKLDIVKILRNGKEVTAIKDDV